MNTMISKGLDDHNSVGIGGAIVRNGMSPKLVMNIAIAFYIIAALLGIFLAIQSSFWIIPVGIICMAIGYLADQCQFHGLHLVSYSLAYLWV